jgi:16S rRNA (guanine(966)-N(2))-methyltransferase RsmD
MRIIAGERRGLPLKTIKRTGFRPTLDRVKESLFGTIAPHLSDAHVLDLFAGSGALSLESLSRGAADAILIEKSAQAVKVIEQNIAALGYDDRCEVVHGDFTLAGKRVAPAERFDLVFADPPYDRGYVPKILAHLLSVELMHTESLLIVEMSRREAANLPSDGFEQLREKRFGDTVIWILRRL